VFVSAGTGENPFDHEFGQWLPDIMGRVHKFAVDGLRRPSSDASSLQDAIHSNDELQSAKLQIAAQKRSIIPLGLLVVIARSHCSSTKYKVESGVSGVFVFLMSQKGMCMKCRDLEELQRRLAQSNGAASNGSAAKAEQEAAERVRAAEARCRQAEGDAATVRSKLTALQGTPPPFPPIPSPHQTLYLTILICDIGSHHQAKCWHAAIAAHILPAVTTFLRYTQHTYTGDLQARPFRGGAAASTC